MSAYDQARHFADSWGLVALVAFFLLAIGWAFRPGSKRANERARMSILRDEDANHG